MEGLVGPYRVSGIRSLGPCRSSGLKAARSPTQQVGADGSFATSSWITAARLGGGAQAPVRRGSSWHASSRSSARRSGRVAMPTIPTIPSRSTRSGSTLVARLITAWGRCKTAMLHPWTSTGVAVLRHTAPVILVLGPTARSRSRAAAVESLTEIAAPVSTRNRPGDGQAPPASSPRCRPPAAGS